ncbi:hypothetical protein AB1Y20_015639 [Prymnesium parvum]|uniref:RRM domain-containing protein n=1 Tax=Prymnesium parvum TaxID=97485 RepID=A0AB34IIF3_PRYPA
MALKMGSTALTDRPFSKTQLFCSNLPWSVNGKMLRQAFEVYGEVTDAFVAYNGRSSRGFGYVTFKEAGGAAEAVQKMNGQPLGDENDRSREIRVEMARERPGPRPEPRERAAGENGERGNRRAPREEDGGGRGRGEGRGRGGRGGRGGEEGEGKGERTRRQRADRGKGRGGDADGAKREARAAVSEAADAVASMTVADAKAPPAVEESSES